MNDEAAEDLRRAKEKAREASTLHQGKDVLVYAADWFGDDICYGIAVVPRGERPVAAVIFAAFREGQQLNA